MPGGILNLVSEGQANIMINGNPSKSFWKAKYAKHTNFGKQNFRLDYEGSTNLRLNEESTFNFKVKRYGDLLLDAFISVTLPNIWSPIQPPTKYKKTEDGPESLTDWAPYEFKWNDYIGAQMIRKISITCGNQQIQEYSGQYLIAMVLRDFNSDKKDLFYRMIGHVPEINDPKNAFGYSNSYPNAYAVDNNIGCEPSIMGRVLSIPLGAWFTMKDQNALPLVALQYNEINISITFAPISQLFKIRDVTDYDNNFPYIAPNFNRDEFAFYRFVQAPPDVALTAASYADKRSIWNADIHLNCNYVFLSDPERDLFAKNEQTYLYTQPHEKTFYNIVGSKKISLESLGLVKDWMFFLRRSDVNLRNEWTNYTNWPYNFKPFRAVNASYAQMKFDISLNGQLLSLTPGTNYEDSLTSGLIINETYTPENQKEILVDLGILFEGNYRENVFHSNIYKYNQKYSQTGGNATEHLYCYNFCLNTSPYALQPCGAINMNHFKTIEFEITTILPPVNPYVQHEVLCDETGEFIVGINKPIHGLYEYTFDLVLFEEKINMIKFVGGNAGIVFAN